MITTRSLNNIRTAGLRVEVKAKCCYEIAYYFLV